METLLWPEFAVGGHTRRKAVPDQGDKGSRPGVVPAGACAQERGPPCSGSDISKHSRSNRAVSAGARSPHVSAYGGTVCPRQRSVIPVTCAARRTPTCTHVTTSASHPARMSSSCQQLSAQAITRVPTDRKLGPGCWRTGVWPCATTGSASSSSRCSRPPASSSSPGAWPANCDNRFLSKSREALIRRSSPPHPFRGT